MEGMVTSPSVDGYGCQSEISSVNVKARGPAVVLRLAHGFSDCPARQT